MSLPDQSPSDRACIEASSDAILNLGTVAQQLARACLRSGAERLDHLHAARTILARILNATDRAIACSTYAATAATPAAAHPALRVVAGTEFTQATGRSPIASPHRRELPHD